MKRFLSEAAALALCLALLFSAGVRAEESQEEERPFSGLPAQYDMRESGIVTPVKLQWPWGSCWAHGAVAAAETSILSAMGKTFAEVPLDLSEKHVAWFARHPVTERDDPAQAGEGDIPIEEQTPGEPADSCYNGGSAFVVAAQFAMGFGPALEEQFPYRGAEGLLEIDLLKTDPDRWKEAYRQYHPYLVSPEKILTEEELQAFTEGKLDPMTDEGIQGRKKAQEDRLVEEAYRKKLAEVETGTYFQYAQADDWTIPETDGEGKQNRSVHTGFVLTDYNSLPPLNGTDEATGKVTLNPDGLRAAKQEILEGRGVAVTYYAEAYSPAGNNTDYYYNWETSAHYTYDTRRELVRDGKHSNHVVCIVGWDDHYPAANFTHEVHMPDAAGNPAVDPERSAKTTPPGDGAWLIKNSRGSETEAAADGMVSTLDGKTYPAHYSRYGLKDGEGRHTGYDWISYYDLSLAWPGSMAFEVRDPEEAWNILQYDYLANDGEGMLACYLEKGESPLPMANCFTAGKDGEIAALAIYTPKENCRVTWRICVLADGAKDPEDGTVVLSCSEHYPYPGYHRMTLPRAVPVQKGQRFSVIADVSAVGSEGKRMYIRTVNAATPEIGKAIVNPGESFAKTDGTWTDWSDMLQTEAVQSQLNDDIWQLEADNFPLKAFIR